MTQNKTGKELLENAYRLATPADNRSYYRDFSDHYDDTFAQGLGYALPRATARRYLALHDATDTPIADIGCGTGLLAEALPDCGPIDGFDISAEMLAKAREKAIYRALYEVDLTADLSDLPQGYGAVLSSGTFTHGHLGPDTLERLIPLARPGGLFVISINRTHYDSHGFAACLTDLEAAGTITGLNLTETEIYTTPGHDHSQDTALLCSFRRG